VTNDGLWVLWERTSADLDKKAEYKTQQGICHGGAEHGRKFDIHVISGISHVLWVRCSNVLNTMF
jgi:hypothetical protein